jgi:hypothetical protein
MPIYRNNKKDTNKLFPDKIEATKVGLDLSSDF